MSNVYAAENTSTTFNCWPFYGGDSATIHHCMALFQYCFHSESGIVIRNEPHHDNTNKMECAPSEDSDQSGHPPSLTRVFAVRLMGS